MNCILSCTVLSTTVTYNTHEKKSTIHEIMTRTKTSCSLYHYIILRHAPKVFLLYPLLMERKFEKKIKSCWKGRGGMKITSRKMNPISTVSFNDLYSHTENQIEGHFWIAEETKKKSSQALRIISPSNLYKLHCSHKMT